MNTPASNLLRPIIRLSVIAAVCAFPIHAFAGPWSTRLHENPDGPGMALDVMHDGKPAARFIHGEGQMKPFLHVFGVDGELLTNPGLDTKGKQAGRFPHHRGIFIGWNQIRSELGNDDLWHFRRDEWMDVTKLHEPKTAGDHTEIVAEIAWRSSKKDAADSNILLNEVRTLRISKPDRGGTTVVDAKFELTAARDLKLDGDLQHAGVHFRAHDAVGKRADETIYIWAPEADGGNGRIINPDMRWCRFSFPLGERWYSAIQLNAPTNPTEELSWRDYGRFGFFFKREMKKGDSLTLNYRFIVSTVTAPREDGYTEAVVNLLTDRSEEAYKKFVEGL